MLEPSRPPTIPTVPAHWTFPSDPAAVRRARQAEADVLSAGGLPQLRDDLQLLSSELVTNAVCHNPDTAADHHVELVLWPADGHYWVTVSDAGTGTALPPPARHSPTPMPAVGAACRWWTRCRRRGPSCRAVRSARQ